MGQTFCKKIIGQDGFSVKKISVEMDSDLKRFRTRQFFFVHIERQDSFRFVSFKVRSRILLNRHEVGKILV